MKLIKELSIIMGVLFLFNIIKGVSNIPIPATVLEMIIILILLLCSVIKPESIGTVTDFLLDNLTSLFVSGGVGLITSFGLIKGQVAKILIVAIITFFRSCYSGISITTL